MGLGLFAELASMSCINSPLTGNPGSSGSTGTMNAGGSTEETTTANADGAGDSPATDGGGSESGANRKTVFLTSTMYKGGELGGLAGADAKCQARANTAGLMGIYRAWLSDSTGSPSSRFARAGAPYVLVNGAMVANNWVGLTSGSLRHAIDVTELGGGPPTSTGVCGSPYVWSDTDTSGNLSSSNSCGDWSDVNGDGTTWGLATNQGSAWSSSCTAALPGMGGCGTLAPIYCFQQ